MLILLLRKHSLLLSMLKTVVLLNINVFVDQFNASLLKKSIHFLLTHNDFDVV